MADCGEKKKQAPGGGGMSAVVKLVVKTFLEPEHFRRLQRILGRNWSNCHSLTAAVKLLEAHGVKMTPEDEKRLSELPEERMIDALVVRMPQQSREQFEHFFLQLSFIASTTTRLRSGLEGGAPDAIEEALENAENVGVLPYLLKMAVAQSCQEVQTYDASHEQWLGECQTRIAPLMAAQGAQMNSQKALTQAKALLAMYQEDAKEKTRAVMLALADGNRETLMGMVFKAWVDFAKALKRESQIRAEYQDQLNAAKAKLHQYRCGRVAMARRFLSRSAEEKDRELVALGFSAFRQEVLWAKNHRIHMSQAEELNARMLEHTDMMTSRARKLMARWCGDCDSGALSMTFTAWAAYITDSKENADREQALKVVLDKTQRFSDRQNTLSLSLTRTAIAGTEEGILVDAFVRWSQVVYDTRAKKLDEASLAASTEKLMQFTLRNKAAAGQALYGEILARTDTLLIFCLAHWKRDAKVERMRRYGKEKNQKRKQELIGVRGLFKNFASDLETSLKEGTPRVEVPSRAAERKARAVSAGPKG